MEKLDLEKLKIKMTKEMENLLGRIEGLKSDAEGFWEDYYKSDWTHSKLLLDSEFQKKIMGPLVNIKLKADDIKKIIDEIQEHA